LAGDDRPASVSLSGDDRWNVIVWLDHRAIAEAEEITATQHRVLNYIGGVMSPEMEIPKLMWLKRQLPAQWRRYGRILALADFLAWRASGIDQRSECTLACKWTYLAHERPGWQADFLHRVGLADLKRRARLPERARPIGHPIGKLSPTAADELGLSTDCAVGVGMIDAHAGALGALAGEIAGGRLDHRIAMIAGTATCHMALSQGAVGRAGLRPGRVGTVLRRRGARALAQRGRAVRQRRPPRPPAELDGRGAEAWRTRSRHPPRAHRRVAPAGGRRVRARP